MQITKSTIENLMRRNLIRKNSGDMSDYETAKYVLRKYKLAPADYDKAINIITKYINI